MASSVPFDESEQKSQANSAAETERLARDLLDHLKEYAQEHPGRAALFCVGLGIYLGWRLKP
jgi:hypothetical protein